MNIIEERDYDNESEQDRQEEEEPMFSKNLLEKPTPSSFYVLGLEDSCSTFTYTCSDSSSHFYLSCCRLLLSHNNQVDF